MSPYFRPLREFLIFGGSSGLYQASRLGVGLVGASLVGPHEFAIWGAVLAILGYANYANLGALSGANRLIPLALGRGDLEAASRLERAAFACSLVASAAALIFGSLVGWNLSETGAALALSIGVTLALQQLYLFYQVSLVARLDFFHAGVQQSLNAVLFPVVALMLLPVLKVGALVLAQLSAFAGAVLLVARWRRETRPSFVFHEVRSLFTAGLPLMAGGLVFSVLVTLDRWLALTQFGASALGQYSVAALLSTLLFFPAMVLSQQVYPRMAMAHGAGDPGHVRRLALLQVAATGVLTLPLVLAILLVVGPMTDLWLPEYRPAVLPAQILAFGVLLLATSTAFGNVLNATGHALLHVILLLTALVVQLTASILVAPLGFGIAGIAIAATLAYAFLTVTTGGAVLIAAVEKPDSHRVRISV